MVVIELHSQDEFNAKLQEAGNKTVAVDFYATWCGPCNMIKPKFKALSDEFTDMIFCSVDVDEVNDIAESKGVSALPTFIFFNGGLEVERVMGANADTLRSTLMLMRDKMQGAAGCGVQCQQTI